MGSYVSYHYRPFYLPQCRNLDNATVTKTTMTSVHNNGVQWAELLMSPVCLAVFKSMEFAFSIALLSSVLNRDWPC